MSQGYSVARSLLAVAGWLIILLTGALLGSVLFGGHLSLTFALKTLLVGGAAIAFGALLLSLAKPPENA